MSSPAALRLQAEIETARPLRVRGPDVLIQGWCFAEDLPDPPPVRLVTASGIIALTGRSARTASPRKRLGCGR